jgi:hypothetical protein
MSIFEKLKMNPENFKKKGEFRKLRTGLYSMFCYKTNRYLLKKNEVVNYLSEEDCEAILKDLIGRNDEN